MNLLERFMPGHKCEQYRPKNAKAGDTYTCLCGVVYRCCRAFPWRKWVLIKNGTK